MWAGVTPRAALASMAWEKAGRVAPLPGKSALMMEMDGSVLSFALGINVQRDMAAIRRLIERKIPVDADALADPGKPFAAMLKAKV